MIFRRLATSLLVVALAAAALAACGSDTKAEPTATPSAPVTSTGVTAKATRPSGTPSAAPDPLSPADLQQRWWAWAAGTSEEHNQVLDPTGRNCGLGQPDDVFFLAGTFGGQAERDCAVPAGRPLAFPIVNLYGTREDCQDFPAQSEGRASVDGVSVEPKRYAATPLSIEAVKGNPLYPDGGKVTGLACGLWVQLAPLAVGKHDITFDGRSGDLRLSVVYHLTVS